MEQTTTIGQMLKRIREGRDLTQEQFAHECGLTKDFISKLERGAIGNPSIETLTKISNAFGLSMHDLIPEYLAS